MEKDMTKPLEPSVKGNYPEGVHETTKDETITVEEVMKNGTDRK